MSAPLFSGWLRSRTAVILLIVLASSVLVCLSLFIAIPGLRGIAARQVLTPLLIIALTAALLGLVLVIKRLDEQKRGLASREDLFKTAQRIGKLGYWHYEAGPDRFVLSDSVHDLLGDSDKNLELTLPKLLEMAHPEDRQSVREFFRRIIADGSSEQFECRIKGLDGMERWFWVEGERLFDTRGHLVRARGACQDVTDRLSTEAALRESEEHYRNAVELNPQIPWTADPEGNILEIGPVWLRLMGMTREDTVGTGWASALHPDDISSTLHVWAQALASGAPVDVEYRLRLAEGGYRWFRARAAARRGDQGKIVRWYGTLEDIHDRKTADAALSNSEAFARSISESTRDCVSVLDLAGHLQFINRPGQKALEIDDFGAWRGRDWVSTWPPEAASKVNEALAAARAGGSGRFFAFCPTTKGVLKWWHVTMSPILGVDGTPDRLLAIARDMSEVKRARDELEDARSRAEDAAAKLESVLSSTTEGIVTYDRDLRFTYLNRQAQHLLGKGAELLGKTHREVFPGPDHDPFRQRYQEVFGRQEPAHFEMYVPAREIWVEFHAYPSGDGMNVFFRDVSERHRSQEKLSYMAHHDVLTGLANRNALGEQIERALAASSPESQTAILFLDLDDFKGVNDRLGHSAGDRLLVLAVERLKYTVRKSDHIARFGGDEFVVVAQVDRPEEASALAERIIASLSRPYEIEGHTLTIGVSIGIAMVSEPGVTAGDVKRNADIALYQAKSEGRGIHRVFNEAMGQNFQDREELKQDLRGALARGEFYVFYQPLIELATFRVKGFEALLRWKHPSRGDVAPSMFIPLAEESGAIVEIGDWVLTTACRAAASWPSDISVAVNISTIQLRNGRLPEVVSGCLSESGLPAHQLQLEITESVLLANTEANLEILTDLRRFGVSISLDDFGTGYSSLSYLRRYPFDKIKIDRSFVADLGNEAEAGSAAIVRAIVDLARTLGLAVTAEGVETEAQADILRGMGCEEGQGYLFSRPVAVDEVGKIVLRFAGAGGETPAILHTTSSE